MRQATPPHLSLHCPLTGTVAYPALRAAIGLLLLPSTCPCGFLEAELAPRHSENERGRMALLQVIGVRLRHRTTAR
jgi:hypothetical protein